MYPSNSYISYRKASITTTVGMHILQAGKLSGKVHKLFEDG